MEATRRNGTDTSGSSEQHAPTVYTSEDLIKHMRTKGKRNKYGVAPKPDRTWRGNTYSSKAEMLYAKRLFDVGGSIVIEQPRVYLGEDTVFRPDFFVYEFSTGDCWFVDVKGTETREFARIKKLWFKHGPAPLRVVSLKNNKFVIKEVVTKGVAV